MPLQGWTGFNELVRLHIRLRINADLKSCRDSDHRHSKNRLPLVRDYQQAQLMERARAKHRWQDASIRTGTVQTVFVSVFALWIFCSAFSPSYAVAAPETEASQEDQLSAAFLYYTAKFISWPELGEKFELCVIDADSLGKYLKETIITRSAHGRSFAVSLFQSPVEISDVMHCNMLYFKGDGNNTRFLRTLSVRPIVTVSEQEDFFEQGGHIRLFKKNNRLRFSISLKNIAPTGLSFNSEFLQLAEQIVK